MDIDAEDAAPQSYTIVRIKRKRTEEPLDALGVFKFAQTVEKDAWEDEKQAKIIQDEISRLTREAADAINSVPTIEPERVPQSGPKHKDEARHYTVLSHNDNDDERSGQVLSGKDLPSKSTHPDFKMFDAVLTIDKAPSTVVDPEMDKFLPMLNDYLKQSPSIKDATPSEDDKMQTDDYVWDVFYHRPATLSEWNEAANVATLSGLPPSITNSYDSASESEEEDEADEDSNGL
ncbi:hypothetical protein H0H87_006280 [Tephrocybe sp. NHM501043]|nr:hypothetical protein H0H87_006280 [Tephrocybe sp. NHM501043]